MRVGFIGFGNMARALARGFIRAGAVWPDNVGACARDMEKLRCNTEPDGFHAFDNVSALVEFSDVVIVAVKPHQVEAVLFPVQAQLAGKIVVSVAAGWTFARYEALLGAKVHVLCTVPNTPVSVGEGIIVCERCHSLTDEEYECVERLLAHTGLVIPVETEQLGIAGTVCGCGPAFVSLFIEALADAGVKHGLSRADAYRMAGQMVVGTGSMLLETGQHPGVLKDAVCSPGGTTIEGVAELERKGLRGAVIDAVDAAQRKK